jgi:hypothetical protein
MNIILALDDEDIRLITSIYEKASKTRAPLDITTDERRFLSIFGRSVVALQKSKQKDDNKQ